jgi:nitrate/nitrite transport system ATP-binding protein
MSFLRIDDVSVRFGQYLALDHVSLAIEKGEVVTLIGHSGCGKSSLLNLVAGLARPSLGSIALDGAPLGGPGPDRGFVFQNHSLLPWMTCLGNVQLGIDRVFGTKLDKAARRSKAEDALRLVHLEHAMHKLPCEISGGMKQRVGIARAIAIEPSLLLLDEPFGALDALTRASLQDELLAIVESTGVTVMMVTHDVDEAILLSDRVVMMTNGPAARLGAILPIDLPRPRDRAVIAADPGYAAYRQTMIRFLHGMHSRLEA